MISWLMDRLSDRVNHGYWYAPDPHSIKNNHYGQWGQPELKEGIMPFNMDHSQYLSYPSVATSTAQVTACGVTGSAIGGVTMPFVTQGAAAYSIGSIVTIAFTDVRGITWALDVDQAYMQTMIKISQAHQMKVTNGQAAPPTRFAPPSSPCMLEGDFTEVEMELAETIISELEGGNDKGYNKDIQEDIDCTT